MIAFLIGDLAMRGGTHKQFLKLLQYAVKEQVDFFVITLHLDFDKTYTHVSNRDCTTCTSCANG